MEDKNYYDWLEVSPKASSEVIEKAYKALVRKYHPDLQEGDKLEAEELMKKINEAYDVLSNAEKRAKYDATLELNDVSKEDYDKLQQELNNLKQQTMQNNNSPQGNTASTTQPGSQPSYQSSSYASQEELLRQQQELERRHQAELEYQRQVEAARQKAYHDAYIQDLRNRGYKIRYKKSFKDYVRIAITILILIVIAIIAWQIPFIRNWFIDLYNNNEILQLIINVFKKSG